MGKNGSVSQSGESLLSRDLPLYLDRFLAYRVARLATALSRSLAAHYEKQFQISVAEWRVLLHLTQQSEISIRDIFIRVDMDRARVTRAVQRLEARSLVSKIVNASDRRLIQLALTTEGEKMAGELSRIAHQFEVNLLQSTPPDTGNSLLAAFDDLEAVLNDPNLK
ncbi:MAG: MarR family transcriptional regulator [Bacteroidetes bacterium]|nr:MarR family transcriptional regulator [Bacteroidota bacterium]